MRRRRGGAGAWGPAVVPAARRDLVRALVGEAARVGALPIPRHLDHAAALQASFASTAQDLERIRSTVGRAALFWVAAPMAAAALDASQDVPLVRALDAPAPVGLLAVAEPLPAWDTDEIGGLALRDGRGIVEHAEAVPVDAIAWCLRDGVLDIDLLVRPHRLPMPLHGVEPRHLTPFAHFRLPLPARLGAGMPALGEQGVSLGGAWQGPVAFLVSAWVMMMTPTVAQRRTLDPSSGATTVQGETVTATAKQVTVIDLRPMRHVTDPPGGSGRRLTTRHLVRGHWAHQPHGPGRSQRRLQWVASYTRGPKGAPWATTEAVYAWRH